LSPNHIFGVGETRHFKCRELIDTWCTSAQMTAYSRKVCIRVKWPL